MKLTWYFDVPGKTGLYLGLAGCVQEFDELAEIFGRNEGGNDREKVMREAERTLKIIEENPARQSDVEHAKIYIKIMKAASGQDLKSYLSQESKRIANILSTKNVESKRRKDFEIKLNIMKSFQK